LKGWISRQGRGGRHVEMLKRRNAEKLKSLRSLRESGKLGAGSEELGSG
jgi:hypothetical protein